MKLNLKYYIDNNNYTYDELAELVGVNVRTFKRKLNGKGSFDVIQLLELAKLFGVNYSDLFIEEDKSE